MTILPPSKPSKKAAKDGRASASQSGSSVSGGGTAVGGASAPAVDRQKPPLIGSRKQRKQPVPGGGSGVPMRKMARQDSDAAGGSGSREAREAREAHNSDDEYEAGFRDDELERNFAEELRVARGWRIKEMRGDGSCLFRAVADQVYGDEEMHGQVRQLCCDYMEKNRDHFSPFVTEDYVEYVERKRRHNVHGNHVEMQAISEMYLRPLEVYEYSVQPINTFHPQQTPAPPAEERAGGSREREAPNAPIRLSYHGSTHYNSVVDPFSATIGVGLGLPGLDPGGADRQLLEDAIRQSDAQHLEQAMLHDKMHMTDWQRTEEDIRDQVSRESYLDYVRSMEAGRRSPPTTSKGAGGAGPAPAPPPVSQSPPRSARASKTSSGQGSPRACEDKAGSSGGGLYEELLAGAYADWTEEAPDEDALLAQALLLSQQDLIAQYEEDRAGPSCR